MTVNELILALSTVPGNYEVRYEYDGPDTLQEVMAKVVIISHDAHAVLLAESTESNYYSPSRES